MAITDLTLMNFLKAKMQWHQGRQVVLAENVANADTPGYRARDLKPFKFETQLQLAQMRGVPAARTHKAHFAGALASSNSAFATDQSMGWEVTPGGNGVVLEEQMIKVSENQFDFQLATTLYTRSLGRMRTALGRSR